jgi:hypothetical protein
MSKAATRAALAALATIALPGCVVSIGDSNGDRAAEAVPPPPVPGQGACNAAAAQGHIGHSATQAMGEAILKDAGARTLRWGPPNGAWTMDYREDRVNVRYNAAMKITEIACG